MCMFRRILSEGIHPSYGQIDFLWRYDPLFGQSVRHDNNVTAGKEIQHTIVPAAEANAQLIDTIAQIIGLRPPQLVTLIA